MKKDHRIEKLFAERRWCFDIPESSHVEGYGYRVSIVFEREPGHFPTGTWPFTGAPGEKLPWFCGPTLAEAQAQAAEMNEQLGIDEREAVKIVASSMGSGARKRGR